MVFLTVKPEKTAENCVIY